MFKSIMKMFLSLLILVSAYLPFYCPKPASAAHDYNVGIEVNGSLVNFPDQKPFIDTSVSRTYVPVRFVSEALGANVNWNQRTATVTINKSGLQVYLTINSDKATVGVNPVETVTLDAPAVLVNNRTLVPLRFVSEVLGAQVVWDKNNRLVSINEKKAFVPAPKEENESVHLGRATLCGKDGYTKYLTQLPAMKQRYDVMALPERFNNDGVQADTSLVFPITAYGDVYIVNVLDQEGNPVKDYADNPLSLVMEYDSELLAAIGCEDVSKMAIYRWGGSYYIKQPSRVNETEGKVTAEITKPGQYLLAKDK